MQDKEVVLARLRRIEGQVRGVAKMVEDGRYCPDVLMQVSAVQGALANTTQLILEGHIRDCVARAISEGHGDAAIDELMTVLRRTFGS